MVKLDPSSPSIPEFTRYTALGAASFTINLGLSAAFHEIFSVAEWFRSIRWAHRMATLLSREHVALINKELQHER